MEIQFPLFVVGLSVGVTLVIFALVMSSVSIESKISDIRVGYVYLQTEVRHLRRVLEESENKSDSDNQKTSGPMRGIIAAKGLSEEDMASVNDRFLELTNKTIEEAKYSELSVLGVPADALTNTGNKSNLETYLESVFFDENASREIAARMPDERMKSINPWVVAHKASQSSCKCPYCGTGYVANERNCEKCGAPR